MNKPLIPTNKEITALKKENQKLQTENSKLKDDKSRMENIIEKRDIQLLRATLKLEKQEMTHIKQMNKLEEKVVDLKSKLFKFTNPTPSFTQANINRDFFNNRNKKDDEDI
jgi:hypothetical protein